MRGAVVLGICSLALVIAGQAHADRVDDRGIYVPPAGVPTIAELEARGATVGTITIHVENIFDPRKPGESAWLYRTANTLHTRTQESTVRAQLLFGTGDSITVPRAAETERILRSHVYLVDAWVVPVRYDSERNVADIAVTVRDVWTLSPDVSFARSGGKNGTSADIEEENLFGTGTDVQVGHKRTVDRDSTSYSASSQNVAQTWWRGIFSYENNSDGRVVTYDLERPFYSLDTHRAYGVSGVTATSVVSRYDFGQIVDQFQKRQHLLTAYFGRSSGLINGWTRRWYAGVRQDEEMFAEAPFTHVPARPLPPSRRLQYVYVAWEIDEDKYAKTENQDQIGRTEDLYYGATMYAELGFASPALGADRTAALPKLTAGNGWKFGDDHRLFVGLGASGRFEGGRLDNGVLNTSSRYYWLQGPHSLFYGALASTSTTRLDPDAQVLLGGDTGLRGYPLRYQAGASEYLATVEERIYTDWYPFRLVRIGAAVFADTGRVWGRGPQGELPLGQLSDVGFGLRLGNTRSGLGNVVHIDLAWALNAGPQARHFQISVQTQRSY